MSTLSVPDIADFYQQNNNNSGVLKHNYVEPINYTDKTDTDRQKHTMIKNTRQITIQTH